MSSPPSPSAAANEAHDGDTSGDHLGLLPDSLPITPALDSAEHAAAAVADATPAPDDLETLVTELRASLASTQTLLSSQAARLARTSELETELAQLKDQHAFVSAAKEAVSVQLAEEVKRREVAEENVDLLRSQVEQARRGVMQLQKQEKDRRRISSQVPGAAGAGLAGLGGLLTIDDEAAASGAGALGGGLAVPDESRAPKRSSMLLRGGHRRVSSQSDPGEMQSTIAALSLSPPAQSTTVLAGGLRELRLGQGLGSPIAPTSPRDGLPPVFDDAASMSSAVTGPMAPPASGSELGLELSAAKDEVHALRSELVGVHARLAESEEARIASDTCLRALREFLASATPADGAAAGATATGEGAPMAVDLSDDASPFAGLAAIPGLRLPPLPTDKDAHARQDDDDSMSPRAAEKRAAWGGFRLWNNRPTSTGVVNASPAPSTAVEPPTTPHSPPALSARSIASSDRPERDSIRSFPTPGEEQPSLTSSISASTTTPLAAFVSSWTKTVSPGNPNPTPSSTSASTSMPPPSTSVLTSPSSLVPPGTSRKISSFFSRARGLSENKDKDLPPDLAPIGTGSSATGATGATGLQPSPTIGVVDPDPATAAAEYEMLSDPELAGLKLPPKPSDEFIPSPIVAEHPHIPHPPTVPAVPAVGVEVAANEEANQEVEGEKVDERHMTVDTSNEDVEDAEKTPVVGQRFQTPAVEVEPEAEGEAEKEDEEGLVGEAKEEENKEEENKDEGEGDKEEKNEEDEE